MSTIGSDIGDGDDLLLAGEFVLGVLDAEASAKVRTRIANEPAFARLVLDWEARLGPWLLEAGSVAPPPQLWPRLRTRLGWPAAAGGRHARGWNDAGTWRALAALATAAAIAALAVALRPTLPTGSEAVPYPTPDAIVGATPISGEAALTRPVAVLRQPDGSVGWMAAIDAIDGKLHMTPVPRPVDAQGRIHELWLIAPGSSPRSLGFVSNERAHTVLLPDALKPALAAGTRLAITLEQAQGLPHAAPAGPIVASGEISRI